MLSEKDIGKLVTCEGRRGRLEAIRGELIQVDMGLAGPWIGGSGGWTLDKPAVDPADVAGPALTMGKDPPCVCIFCGARAGDGQPGCLETMPPKHLWGAPAARDAERERAEGPTVTPEGLPLAARLRRWAEAHVPAGVTATALRALLSEAADEIERLAEEQRKIIDLCGRGDDAGVTAVQAVAQMRERLDAVEESAEAARAEWIDRDLGE